MRTFERRVLWRAISLLVTLGANAPTWAEMCAAPSLNMSNYALNFPCVSAGGAHYALSLDYVVAASAWKLVTSSIAPSGCDATGAACVSLGADFGLNASKLDLAGQPYSLVLKRTEHPSDAGGYYWQYAKHYSENPPPAADGKPYDVRVSYYDTYDNAMTKKQAIEDNITRFADGVYEASNGAQRLGRVTIYTDGAFSDNADIVWRKDMGDNGKPCWFNAHVAGRGRPGARIQHCDNGGGQVNTLVATLSGGYTLLHEWGHFFYGLYDEYVNPSTPCGNDPSDPCQGDTGVQNSVMNSTDNAIENNTLKDPKWLNFSTALNSNAGTNANFRVYQASAWEILQRAARDDPASTGNNRPFYPEMAAVAPQPGQEPSIEINTPEGQARARSALVIDWNRGSAPAQTRRAGVSALEAPMARVLLLDRSAAVAPAMFDKIKAAAQNIVQRAAIGEVIGLVAFDATPEVLVTPTLIQGQAEKNTLLVKIKALTASSTLEPAFGDALLAAENSLLSAQLSEESDWMVYLLANGRSQAGIAPVSVARELRANGIALYSLGFGNAAGETGLMQSLSEETQGGYWQIADLKNLDAILEEVEQSASPVVDVQVAANDSSFTGSNDFNWYLDASLAQVELNLTYSGAAQTMQLSLTDPQGALQTLDPATVCDMPAADALSVANEIDCWLTLNNPAEGTWTLHAQATDGSAASLAYFVNGLPADNNESFFATLEPNATTVEAGATVILTATVGEDFPLTGLTVAGQMEKPDASLEALTWRDDGAEPDRRANDGLYTTSIITSAAGDYFFTANFDNTQGNGQYSNYGVSYKPIGGVIPSLGLTPLAKKFQRVAQTQVVAQ